MEEEAAPAATSTDAQHEAVKNTESTVTEDRGDKAENHIDETVPEKPVESVHRDENNMPDSDSATQDLSATNKDSETTVTGVAVASESTSMNVNIEPVSAVIDILMDSQSVAQDASSAEPKTENVEYTEVDELDSSKLQDKDASLENNDDIENITEDNEKAADDVLKLEDTADGSQVTKVENSQEETTLEESKNDDSQDNTLEEAVEVASKGPEEAKDDDLERSHPEFETAPTAADESQEDHTQALDPFDALLKDQSTEQAADVSAAGKADVNPNVNLDDDDDRGMDTEDIHDDSHANDDEPPLPEAEAEAEVEAAAEPEAEMGADEEVCLLPDTEREISEADKAAAERVLAEKRKLAEEEAATMVPKEEDEPAAEEAADGAADEAADEAGEEGGEELEPAAMDEPATENGDNNQDSIDDADSAPHNVIQEIQPVNGTCHVCGAGKNCEYRMRRDGDEVLLCARKCVTAFQHQHPGANYTLASKKYVIVEIEPATMTCSECEESKTCYFYYKYDGEDTNYCSLTCLNSMMADEVEQYSFKRRRLYIKEVDGIDGVCVACELPKRVYYSCDRFGETIHFCDLSCVKLLNAKEAGRYIVRKLRAARSRQPARIAPPLLKLKVISNATDKYIDEAHKIQAKTPAAIQAAKEDRERSFIRMCTQCSKEIQNDDKNLTWETMEFCDDTCLGKFQRKVGSKCANCQSNVTHASLGKYCVRFGFDIRQFCNSSCLEEFKKGLKICCYCQKDISNGQEGFLAPIGDKGQFKDFCSQVCMVKFDQMSKNPVPPPVWAKCAVCSTEKATTIEVATNSIDLSIVHRLCSDPCFAAFKFVNNIFPDQCQWCKKYFERRASSHYTIYENNSPMCFCTQSCINVYISNSRFIVPCNWCKVKKYNFDMIKRNKSSVMMCSLNCLSLYQVSVNAVSSKRIRCDMCRRAAQAQYHLTMSDASVRNFCTYQCVMSFQGQYSKPTPAPAPAAAGEPPEQAVPTGAPRRYQGANKANAQQKSQRQSSMPVISAVQSLAPPPLAPSARKSKRNMDAPDAAAPATPPPPPRPATPPPPPPPKIYNHVLVKTLPPTAVANKATMTKPMMVSKGVSCRPHPCTKECQTDPSLERRILIPVPVPIYVPVPCAMWSIPFPIPVPIPLPIPTPVFIPTTRNSAKGIMKEISKIHDKMPTDPFEAELLMMAEMVAGDKKKDQSDSDTDDDNAEAGGFSPVAGMDGNNFGEDMLQMALKMATEYEEQPVDLESAMTANTITPSSHPGMPGLEGDMHHHHMMVLEQQRAVAALRASAAPRKRVPPAPPVAQPARARGKRGRRGAEPPPPEPPREPAEKPDANMCLKYTFGVNAWKQWVMTKNAELEKSSVRKKPFKSEILQLTADELNFSLCLFVREVRKPNGSEYAPDTIYYLVLGIQQYLFENGRIDNIFTDPYYEKFTDCLDEVARKFSVLYNDSQYIVTRVEEEHLWESKQLGAHSPHVLLSTLMFFNTKHFNLVSVDEHMQLSFSHIMKHWKRNPNQPGQAKVPGSRNVLLRFYPPQSALEANSRKKKVYEQQENEDNPLRCPVKLYEFYISKCPESVRTRNDVFYLQPERSCVPDSPVWYSTQPLSRAALAKMLHRVKMVKEINIALLTS